MSHSTDSVIVVYKLFTGLHKQNLFFAVKRISKSRDFRLCDEALRLNLNESLNTYQPFICRTQWPSEKKLF